jgi:type VI secretion system secreted protein VgrG
VSDLAVELASALEKSARRNLVARLGDDGAALSVRRFEVREGVSTLFEVRLELASPDPSLDFGAIVGRPASLRIEPGLALGPSGTGRAWAGVCSHFEQLRAERDGWSTYGARIVPKLWLLGLRRDHRIFQHLSAPEIALRVLERWAIRPVLLLDRDRFPPLPFKVQYGETDLAFLLRITEEAGIAITFTDDDDEARPVLHDALGTGEARAAPPIRDLGPTEAWASEGEQATNVRIAHRLRPGALVARDVDLRRPLDHVVAEARDARPTEARLEQHLYAPGAFLVDVAGADRRATPTADDRGATRHADDAGRALAERMLASLRSDARVVAFDTNVLALRPGEICALDTLPRADLADAPPLLVVGSTLSGRHDGEWAHTVEVVRAGAAYRPARRTPKPKLVGVQSAMVVGPAGDEIHVDELGRVRVQFPWDREGKADDASSCWVPVSQGWSGSGYGMVAIPRIGQEVLVGFVEGDPEAPVIVGRMYNATAPVPHALPAQSTVSAWKSQTSPRGSGGEGFNEIRFDDRKREELVVVQAERNMRRLVKNDETITVGHDLEHRVEALEEHTTGGRRVEVTHEKRKCTTYGRSVTDLHADAQKLVDGDERDDTRSARTVRVRGDLDAVTHGTKRERVGQAMHVDVVGNRREHVAGAHSLTVVEDDQIEVSGTYALEAGATMRFVSGEALVGEGVDLTLKGPGGFVRIDAGGVTIGGTMVRINTPARSRSGRPVRPRAPDRAEVAPVLPDDEEASAR